MIINTEKLRRELGYADVVSAYDATRETVEWLIAHPVTAAEYPLYNPVFDYSGEDRMIRALPGSWFSS